VTKNVKFQQNPFDLIYMKINLNINIFFYFENIYTLKTERKNGKRKKKKIIIIETNLSDRAIFLIPVRYMMSLNVR